MPSRPHGRPAASKHGRQQIRRRRLAVRAGDTDDASVRRSDGRRRCAASSASARRASVVRSQGTRDAGGRRRLGDDGDRAAAHGVGGERRAVGALPANRRRRPRRATTARESCAIAGHGDRRSAGLLHARARVRRERARRRDERAERHRSPPGGARVGGARCSCEHAPAAAARSARPAAGVCVDDEARRRCMRTVSPTPLEHAHGLARAQPAHVRHERPAADRRQRRHDVGGARGRRRQASGVARRR